MCQRAKQTLGRILLLCVCLTIVVLLSGCSWGVRQPKAEIYPNRDISFLIPNAPGGGNDLTVRALIPGMKKVLSVDILPENRPAAKGAAAAAEIMNGKSDGYKLYFNSQTLLLMTHGGMPDVQLEKFQPIAQVVEDTAGIIVRADAPYRDLAEFIRHAKANPGKVKVAHAGIGALWHLAAIQFSKAAGIEFKYVGYTAGTSGMRMLDALEDGEVDVCLISPSESKPLIDSGGVKVLAVMSERRHGVVPQVPTCIEAGINAVFPVWRGIFTTAGVDERVIERLEEAIGRAVEMEEFKAFTRNNGLPVRFRGHREFKEFVYQQRDAYAKLMAEPGRSQ